VRTGLEGGPSEGLGAHRGSSLEVLRKACAWSGTRVISPIPNEHAIQENGRSEKNWADLGYTGLFNL